MKFGKRLHREAACRWPEAFVDYKALKQAIKADVGDAARGAADPAAFHYLLLSELDRTAMFYSMIEAQLASRCEAVEAMPAQGNRTSLRRDALELRRAAVLNQMAVAKAVKKARRRLAGRAPAVESLDVVVLLAGRSFFSSTRLAHLLTVLDVQAAGGGDGRPRSALAPPRSPFFSAPAETAADFTCPICLDLLRGPVVLTCAHRVCWSCLLAHAEHSARFGAEQAVDDAAKPGDDKAGVASESGATSSGSVIRHGPVLISPIPRSVDGGCATPVLCPVCRQQQLLNLDRLRIDPVLEAFVEALRREGGGERTVDSASPKSQGSSTDQSETPLHSPRPLESELRPRTSGVEEDDCALAAALPTGLPIPGAGRWPGPKPPPPTPPRRASLLDIEDDTGFDPVLPPLDTVAAPPPQQLVRGDSAEFVPSKSVDAADAVKDLDAMGPGLPLLPPVPAGHGNKLTLCLDLDGTLVTTFSPARAPILPRGIQAYTVGAGSRLNPAGVVVVERPGLGDFLRRVSRCAELVLFTAGLEEYAGPIADALEARYERFAHRLYRPATVPSPEYPCVKDLSRLGRPLSRTMLADDTPLAFSAQPDNGIPVHAFRGDVDDRLLTEALAPLVESLAGAVDVRSALHARFAMRAWFDAQKAVAAPGAGAGPVAPRRPLRPGRSGEAARGASRAAFGASSPRRPPLHKSASSAALPMGQDSPRAGWRPRVGLGGGISAGANPAVSLAGYDTEEDDAGIVPPPALVAKLGTLLVLDFDQTLIHVDAGHWLAEALVPELASLLDVPDPRESWVPATNAVWREAARRGVDPPAVAAAMRALAAEVPPESAALLRWAAREAGWACALLSDCNTLVIGGVLEALGATLDVDAVITNPATWTPQGALHVEPRHVDRGAVPPPGERRRPARHGAPCGHCPSNLCKGAEMDAIVAARRAAHPSPFSAGASPRHERVVYVGDGTNDLCPALRLEPHDVVLARKGYPLDRMLEEHASAVRAQVHRWASHAELLHLVKSLGP